VPAGPSSRDGGIRSIQCTKEQLAGPSSRDGGIRSIQCTKEQLREAVKEPSQEDMQSRSHHKKILLQLREAVKEPSQEDIVTTSGSSQGAITRRYCYC